MNRKLILAAVSLVIMISCSESIFKLHYDDGGGELFAISNNDTIQLKVLATRNRIERNINLHIYDDLQSAEKYSFNLRVKNYATATNFDKLDDSLTYSFFDLTFYLVKHLIDEPYYVYYTAIDGKLLVIKDDSNIIEGEFDMKAVAEEGTGFGYDNDTLIINKGNFKIKYSKY